MPPVRQAIKSASPAPERAAQPKASRPISPAAALQSRVGNGGVQQLIAARLTGGAGKATAVPGAPAPTGTASGPRLAVDTAAPGVSAPAGTAEAAPGDAPAPEKRRPAADNKAKGEAAPAAEGAAAKEAEPGERGGGAAGAPVTVELHMPEPPSRPSPATVKRDRRRQGARGGKATAQAALPPGAKQVGDAQKAVTPPDAERAAAGPGAADRRRSRPPRARRSSSSASGSARSSATKRPPDEDALAGGQARGGGGRSRRPAQRDRRGRDQEGPGQLRRHGDEPARRRRRSRERRSRRSPPPPRRPPINAKAAVPDAGARQATCRSTRTRRRARKKTEDAGMDKPRRAARAERPDRRGARARRASSTRRRRRTRPRSSPSSRRRSARPKPTWRALQMQALAALDRVARRAPSRAPARARKAWSAPRSRCAPRPAPRRKAGLRRRADAGQRRC